MKNKGFLVFLLLFAIYAMKGPLWLWKEPQPTRLTLAEFTSRQPDSMRWFDLREMKLDIAHLITVKDVVGRMKEAFIPLLPRDADEHAAPVTVVLITEDPTVLGWLKAIEKGGKPDEAAASRATAAMEALQKIDKVSGLLRADDVGRMRDDKVERNTVILEHHARPSVGWPFVMLILWIVISGLLTAVAKFGKSRAPDQPPRIPAGRGNPRGVS